jgi:hypothetical protein
LYAVGAATGAQRAESCQHGGGGEHGEEREHVGGEHGAVGGVGGHWRRVALDHGAREAHTLLRGAGNRRHDDEEDQESTQEQESGELAIAGLCPALPRALVLAIW